MPGEGKHTIPTKTSQTGFGKLITVQRLTKVLILFRLQHEQDHGQLWPTQEPVMALKFVLVIVSFRRYAVGRTCAGFLHVPLPVLTPIAILHLEHLHFLGPSRTWPHHVVCERGHRVPPNRGRKTWPKRLVPAITETSSTRD